MASITTPKHITVRDLNTHQIEVYCPCRSKATIPKRSQDELLPLFINAHAAHGVN